jgi:hypothetical protein
MIITDFMQDKKRYPQMKSHGKCTKTKTTNKSISSATFKDVNHEEMLNAVQRYCNYLYIKGIEIKSKYNEEYV